jgi:diguanylate cyclase (GGDEF)-like protein
MDPLTGLPNRRGFMEKLGQQITKAVHWDWPVAILVLDLDHFKKVNDKFGHPVGDQVLAAAAHLMRDAAGPLDNVARIGGEEFAIAAVGAEHNNAADLADRIVRSFRIHDWETLKPGLAVTCSIGVAIRQPSRESQAITDLSDLIDEADRALLLVKQRGRNGYLLASDTGGASPAPSTRSVKKDRVGTVAEE